MIKIDLHIHTVSSVSDADFTFSLPRLQEYVSKRHLDCIAITNHNLFDKNQFISIDAAIPITVLPGIEIDLAGSQILLISNGENLDDFEARCHLVQSACPSNTDSITVSEFKYFFTDLSEYILIPHYEKKPKISYETLQELSPHVTAGEVTNPKKFIYCLKDINKLVPVYFSDFRSSESGTPLPYRHTYLNCEDATFSAIKNCLRDKSKVSLSPEEGNPNFQIFEDGQQLSTGLNVLIGARSTGKSHTLNRIQKEFENIRYIRQFSLVERDEEADIRKFNKVLDEKHSLVSSDYLNELQVVVRDIIKIDLKQDTRSVEKYVQTLIKYAKEEQKHDSFSKAKLYSEEMLQIGTLQGLEHLINSTKNLIKNEEFKEFIEKHVEVDALKNLYVELMQEYTSRKQIELKKRWLNELIEEIKNKLQIKTAVTKVEDVNLYKIAINREKVRKFLKVIRLAQNKGEIIRTSLQGFTIVATAKKFKGAGELKKLSRLKSGFSEAFDVYENPYKFLQKLRDIDNLEESDFYKYFVKIDYKILNKDGFEVSGGERSEFNLLQELQEAQSYDMLLIDEPESSFDNLFLKQEVNAYIKDIAQNMPVVLVTHNSTVGASIRPDYLLCSKKEMENDKIKYRIYSGSPTSKVLKSTDGLTINTRDILLDCLEAGEETYEERRQGYEDIKN